MGVIKPIDKASWVTYRRLILCFLLGSLVSILWFMAEGVALVSICLFLRSEAENLL